MFAHTYSAIHTWTHTHTNTPFKYMHMHTWAHTNIHNQIQLSTHLIGHAYPGILKPSHSYTYNQICTLKDKLISHTHIARHSTGPLTQRNTHTYSGSESNMPTCSDRHAKSYPHPCYTHKAYPSTHTRIHHHMTCSHTETHTHLRCP